MTIKELDKELTRIFDDMIKGKRMGEEMAASVHPLYRLSAKNFYRYLILRSNDIRKIHDDLSELGISSMRTAEGYVFQNISNILKILRLLQGQTWESKEEIEEVGYKRSRKLLRKHANILFDDKSKNPFNKIMVTLPEESAENIDLLRDLVSEGMEVARINLSHGNIAMWQKMVANIHQVKEELGVPVKIYMDLPGPKIRTAKIEIQSIKGKKNQIKNFIKLRKGDHLILTKRNTRGKEVNYWTEDKVLHSAEIGVLLPQVIDDLKVDDTVYFDDGMIKGKVLSKNVDEAKLLITRAYKSKLATNKGINLPDTHLNLPPLTEQDLELLPFVCQYADIVGYSFVRNAEDVAKLYQELEKNGNEDIGVVFKIENREAFQNLPFIILEAMKRSKIGIMIARGDLAVEIGFERISEVQNEILWLCEAAHMPVIWATQVLETLAKTGIATRAEVSDAAISAQAECVMLNKGPFIIDAVRTLRNIISRMKGHAFKKKSRLRALKVAKIALKKMESAREN